MTYFPLTIAGSVLLVYFISYLYTRKNILTRKINYPFTVHRKIWNIVMLILFLVFAPLGFLLAVNKVYYIGINPVHVLDWHVNFGVAFLVIAVFHALWHINYYRKGIRKLINDDFKSGKHG
jgi:hypothetical protein